jgi:hypothetical protein
MIPDFWTPYIFQKCAYIMTCEEKTLPVGHHRHVIKDLCGQSLQSGTPWSHILRICRQNLPRPSSTLGVEIKGINQSIGRTTLLIYNYCQRNCRWYFTIIRCFLSSGHKQERFVLLLSSYPVRNPGQSVTRKLVGQLVVLKLAIYYILQVLSYFKCSIN